MANGYEVNYDDERFATVEADEKEALTELEQTYGGMIDQSDDYFQAQIDATQQWADTQSQIQQEQTDFAIEQIEQQKEQANKDYIKEQSGAYVDWQKRSNQYGSNAEQMAAQGLANTGYSETSQVSMYNTYQNRVATARETYNRAVLNYDNAIKEAQLQNNSILAEIAAEALKQQLELGLQGFQYKNQLLIDQMNKKLEVDQMYYNRWIDVQNQINTENAMAEQIRQFNLNYEEQIRQFNEEIARLKAKDEKEYQMQIQELELKKQQLAEEKRQFDETMAYNKSRSTGSTTGSRKKTGSETTTVSKTTASKENGSNIVGKMELGRGPITDEYLAELVAKGEVIATQKGNQIYVENNPNYQKGSDKFGLYTGIASWANAGR